MSRGNKHTSAGGAFILAATAAWLTLLLLKAAGVLPINWLAVALGVLWIPAAVAAVAFLLALTVIMARDLHQRIRARRVVKRIAKDFNLLAHGEILDKAAQRYGLHRAPGETDKELRERILKFIKEVGAHERL